MSLWGILDQLMANYGMPDVMVLFNNDTLFRSPFPPTEAPKMLFYRTEQCQEIQIIGQDPYSPTHIINVVVRLPMHLGIFPIKEFKTWEAIKQDKSWPKDIHSGGLYEKIDSNILTQHCREPQLRRK
jgi:hypothetical protein